MNRCWLLPIILYLLMTLSIEGQDIFQACWQGLYGRVQILLEQNSARVHARDKEYRATPLHIAAMAGHNDIVKLLLAKGADVHARAANGWTPLFSATLRGHLEVAKRLVAAGAFVHVTSRQGATPLHLAARMGFLPLCLYLLDQGADIKARDKNGETVLHKAISPGNGEVVKLLVQRGAPVLAKNTEGFTAKYLARQKGYTSLVVLLTADEPASLSSATTSAQLDQSVRSWRITILYDNYVYQEGTTSDWGFSCLVERKDQALLFDSGAQPDLLRRNAKTLHKNLADVDLIVLSHIHHDHVGGLFSVLEEAKGIPVFLPHSFPYGLVKRIEEAGGKAVRVKESRKISDNIYLTGELGSSIKEQSLVIDTSKGLVVITGCSHPGIVHILHKAQDILDKKIYLVFGGFHLMAMTDAQVATIIREFKEMQVEFVGCTHCTGERAINLFRRHYGKHFITMGAGKILVLSP